ncbi:MAG: molybdopterin-dependent oxidoreductase, partial [Proteobacteria bacterium]|nr:molybdopterin-dependent oxidoreductase [Pseudomonadota bacterium]
GQKPFVDDITAPEMVHGAIRLSDHARAKVISIDTAPALAMEGVHCVLTARDIGARRLFGTITKDWPVYIAEGELTHCRSSALAAVAADNPRLARKAVQAIKVEYEVLEPLTDPELALEDSISRLTPGPPEVHQGHPNLLSTSTVHRGDVDTALATSAHVLEETFHTQQTEHAFLEPESSLAIPKNGGTILIYSQGQGVFEDREQIADILGLPQEKVVVELVSNGGAFGGKEDLTVQHHAALLARHLNRPTKITLTRDESMMLHPKRHPMSLEYKVGCDEEGHLTAVKARIVGDTGGYASVGDKVLERAAGHAIGPYRVPAVHIEAHAVYTNNPPNGAFRGFGVNQAAFALEGMLDRLAQLVGIDGYDIRERNILEVGDPFGPGQIMTESLGIRPTLEALRQDYKEARFAGISCGIKNTGLGNGAKDIGRALIEVDGMDHVTTYVGFTEMGQGLFTIVRQIICHETGLSPHQIAVKVSTDRAVDCGMTTASRGTLLAGEGTRRAAKKLAEALGHRGLAELQGQSFFGEFIDQSTSKPEDGPHTHLTFGYATQLVILDQEGRLARVIAAHDVGRAINPTQVEGQIEGGIHMGLGYALTEDFPTSDGSPLSTRLVDLRILKAQDMPDVEVRLLEIPDPLTRYGVKGVGEIGLVPTAGAVAAALQAFDGIWRTTLPMRGSAAARAILPRRLHEPDHP